FTTLNHPELNVSSDDITYAATPIDYNGDGLLDLMYVKTGNVWGRLSLGDGTYGNAQLRRAKPDSQFLYTNICCTTDLDGNGLPEVRVGYVRSLDPADHGWPGTFPGVFQEIGWEILVDGSSELFAQSEINDKLYATRAWRHSTYGAGLFEYPTTLHQSFGNFLYNFIDVNGDGLDDFVYNDGPVQPIIFDMIHDLHNGYPRNIRMLTREEMGRDMVRLNTGNPDMGQRFANPIPLFNNDEGSLLWHAFGESFAYFYFDNYPFSSGQLKDYQVRLLDVNSDGQADLTLTRPNSMLAAISNGSIFEGLALHQGFGRDLGTMAIYGDGEPALISGLRGALTGAESDFAGSTGDGSGGGAPPCAGNCSILSAPVNANYSDLAGARPDDAQRSGAQSDNTQTIVQRNNTAQRLYKKRDSFGDVVNQITDGYGNFVRFNYAPLANTDHYELTSEGRAFIDQSQHYRPQWRGVHLVTSIEQNDGIGGTFTTERFYKNNIVDAHRRSGLGFAEVSVVDSRTNIKSTTKFHQAYPLTGRAYESEVRQPNGNLISHSETTWENYARGNPAGSQPQRQFVYTARTEADAYEVSDNPAIDGAFIRKTVSEHEYSHDAPSSLSKLDRSEVNVTNLSESENFRTIVDYTYYNYFDPWCMALPNLVTTTQRRANTADIVQRTKNWYDNQTCRSTK
ncbi:MAG: VCBS repeat-containing protein, partial [Gammaproteobacteria bacterium]|nr:VCBS repeat-containing protein [Gammaproteobacteria bacterium]